MIPPSTSNSSEILKISSVDKVWWFILAGILGCIALAYVDVNTVLGPDDYGRFTDFTARDNESIKNSYESLSYGGGRFTSGMALGFLYKLHYNISYIGQAFLFPMMAAFACYIYLLLSRVTSNPILKLIASLLFIVTLPFQELLFFKSGVGPLFIGVLFLIGAHLCFRQKSLVFIAFGVLLSVMSTGTYQSFIFLIVPTYFLAREDMNFRALLESIFIGLISTITYLLVSKGMIAFCESSISCVTRNVSRFSLSDFTLSLGKIGKYLAGVWSIVWKGTVPNVGSQFLGMTGFSFLVFLGLFIYNWIKTKTINLWLGLFCLIFPLSVGPIFFEFFSIRSPERSYTHLGMITVLFIAVSGHILEKSNYHRHLTSVVTGSFMTVLFMGTIAFSIKAKEVRWIHERDVQMVTAMTNEISQNFTNLDGLINIKLARLANPKAKRRVSGQLNIEYQSKLSKAWSAPKFLTLYAPKNIQFKLDLQKKSICSKVPPVANYVLIEEDNEYYLCL